MLWSINSSLACAFNMEREFITLLSQIKNSPKCKVVEFALNSKCVWGFIKAGKITEFLGVLMILALGYFF